MSNLLFQTIDQISREKGIDPQIVIHAIEDAIVVASRKYFKSNEELRGRINSDTGEIDVFAVRKVVDNVTNPVREISLDEARTVKPDAQLEEEIEFLKPTAVLGRIAAQMAKQVDHKHTSVIKTLQYLVKTGEVSKKGTVYFWATPPTPA